MVSRAIPSFFLAEAFAQVRPEGHEGFHEAVPLGRAVILLRFPMDVERARGQPSLLTSAPGDAVARNVVGERRLAGRINKPSPGHDQRPFVLATLGATQDRSR